MPEPSFGIVTPLMAILRELLHGCYSTCTIMASVRSMDNLWSQMPWVWYFNISCRHCFSYWNILLSRSHWWGEHNTYSHVAIPARLLQAQRVTIRFQYSLCCIHSFFNQNWALPCTVCLVYIWWYCLSSWQHFWAVLHIWQWCVSQNLNIPRHMLHNICDLFF